MFSRVVTCDGSVLNVKENILLGIVRQIYSCPEIKPLGDELKRYVKKGW